jgi:hypothetical protein
VERVTGGAFFLDKEELALAAFFLKDCEVERGVADVRVRFGVDRGVLIPRDGVLLRLPETLEGFDGLPASCHRRRLRQSSQASRVSLETSQQ